MSISNMDNKIKFWQKHLNWFIPFVSELYPLNKFQLLQYEDILDWDRIKSNTFIKWNKETYAVFGEKLAKAEIIEPIAFHVEDMPVVIKYPSVKEIYFREDIQQSKKKTYWKDIDFGMYKKPTGYDEDIILKLLETFDCGIELDDDPFGSMPIPTRFLEGRENTIEWDVLSHYWGLNWSFELLQQFEKYWDTEQLICNHTAFNYCLKDDLDDEFIEKVLNG